MQECLHLFLDGLGIKMVFLDEVGITPAKAGESVLNADAADPGSGAYWGFGLRRVFAHSPWPLLLTAQVSLLALLSCGYDFVGVPAPNFRNY